VWVGREVGGAMERVDLEFWGVSVRVRKRWVLEGAQGGVKSGEVLGLMGPSGSGKTTLLTALAGQVPRAKGVHLEGRIAGNGRPVREAAPRVAFVPQEDLLFSNLTVRETLETSAALRLPRGTSRAARAEAVEGLLGKLGLRQCADSRVGDKKRRGISGGEKKRLALGCELLGSPALVFADEPTTGLDSYQAEKVVRVLRVLADAGHTVVLTIHQPRGAIFGMLDRLALLSQGRLIFSGPAKDAAGFLATCPGGPGSVPANVNPAEFCLDQVSVDQDSPEEERATLAHVNEVANAFAKGPLWKREPPAWAEAEQDGQGRDENGKRKSRGHEGAGRLKQLRVLFGRAWRQAIRDKQNNKVRAMSNLMSAVIFGTVFHKMGRRQTSIQDRQGLLQVAAINTAMASLMKTLGVFPKERVLVNRDRSNGAYGVAPYFVSKLAAELPVSAAFPLIFGAVVYPMCGLDPTPAKLGRFLGSVTLESFCSAALGMCVGSIAPSPEAAFAMGPAVMVIFIVFGGYYVNEENVPRLLRGLPRASLIKWAFQALLVNEMRGLTFEQRPDHPTDLTTGEQALERLGFHTEDVNECAKAQLKLLAGFYGVCYYLLASNKSRFIEPAEPSAGGAPSARA